MLGRKVMVTTATGHYKGILAGMDNNLNIVLTDAINDRGGRGSARCCSQPVIGGRS